MWVSTSTGFYNLRNAVSAAPYESGSSFYARVVFADGSAAIFGGPYPTRDECNAAIVGLIDGLQ